MNEVIGIWHMIPIPSSPYYGPLYFEGIKLYLKRCYPSTECMGRLFYLTVAYLMIAIFLSQLADFSNWKTKKLLCFSINYDL